MANGRQLHVTADAGLTIAELMKRYRGHVRQHYVKNSRPTSEQHDIAAALRFVRELYHAVPVVNFGPLALKAVRQKITQRSGLLCRVGSLVLPLVLFRQPTSHGALLVPLPAVAVAVGPFLLRRRLQFSVSMLLPCGQGLEGLPPLLARRRLLQQWRRNRTRALSFAVGQSVKYCVSVQRSSSMKRWYPY